MAKNARGTPTEKPPHGGKVHSRNDTTPPPQPTTRTATAVSDTAIVVSCVAPVDPESAVTVSKLYKKRTAVSEAYTAVAGQIAFSAYPYTVNGLTPSTSYDFKVTAFNVFNLETALADCTAFVASTQATPPPPDPPPDPEPPVDPGDPADWRLAPGHFVPSVRALNITTPRPDTETSVYALHRRCPSGIDRRLPIGVEGGARPFKYEKVTGPSWAAFERETIPADFQTNGPQGYGVLKLTAPVAGSHAITVKVTDQEGTVALRSWTIEVIDRENTNYFVFVDNDLPDNTGTGSYSSPKKNIVGYYGTTKVAAPFPGRQAIYRGSTTPYATADVPIVNPNLDMTVNKPVVHVGYPGERPKLNMAITGGQGGFFDFETIPGGDVCLTGFELINPEPEVLTNRRKQFVRTPNVTSARRINFDNIFNGGGNTPSDGGTNSSVWMDSGPGPTVDHYAYDGHNVYHQCSNMDLVLKYYNSDFVIEYNTITGGYGGTYNPSWGFFLKGGTIERGSIYFNRGVNQAINRPLVHCSEFTGQRKGDIDVGYNNWKSTQSVGRSSGGLALGQGDGSTGNNYGPIRSFRNNWNVDHHEPTGLKGGGPFTFQSDAIQHSGVYVNSFNPVACTIPITATTLLTGLAIFDPVTNLLTGAARTSGLGTKGCEVV